MTGTYNGDRGVDKLVRDRQQLSDAYREHDALKNDVAQMVVDYEAGDFQKIAMHCINHVILMYVNSPYANQSEKAYLEGKLNSYRQAYEDKPNHHSHTETESVEDLVANKKVGAE